MSFRKPKTIGSLLTEFGPLADAAGRERMARIRTLSAALESVAQHVGVPMLRLQGAGLRTLTLSVPDGATATRLRYANRELLTAIRQCAGLNVARVSVRVDPSVLASPLPNRATRKLRSDAGRSLRAAAEGIDDPELRAALLRLAGRARKDGAE